ncbi:NADP-dependent oxidoreductase [Larkinella knui]|uniref:NADP-dependent oxidoreductase n=1 Tax=Larkinella knui TaxID=2025310 RepID=A0A3P1CHQ9_9BACT|nr:NADP-dependent oxidoreductase [Larkinella knui]RRB12586.1 NADP-dependent oxidoreductase [Larkinella knui]
MKAIVLKHTGGTENFALTELPAPTIQEDQVLVNVKAISINPADVATRYNQHFQDYILKLKPGEPIVLGWDIAGSVEDVGTAVSSFKKGDAVFGMVNFPGHGDAYAEYVAAPASHLALKPDTIGFEEAAAATMTALTAWQSLVTYGKVKTGDRVLIHGASGGVGHFAVQFAKHFGAYVIGSASAPHRDFVRSIGADEFIDYQAQPFEKVVKDVDLVLDGVSMTQEHIERSIQVIKPGGILISLLSGFDDAFQAELTKRQLRGHRLWVNSDGADLTEIAKLLRTKEVKPQVSHRFAFQDMGQAHELLQNGKPIGKVVVTL